MIEYYTMNNLKEYLSLFKITKIKKYSKKKIRYYNIPITFDIETTSAYLDHESCEVIEARKIVKLKEKEKAKFDKDRYEKVAWMYVWQISIDDKLFLGRTWDEFIVFKEALKEKFKLDDKLNLMIFVRNLQFEFQFIKHYFEFTHIFASKPHEVIYARTDDGFEFRCSYFLAGCSLETTGENLIKYQATKQKGLLDYSLIRTPKTPLTEDEIKYCLYDVIVDSCFIRESMEDEKKNALTRLPLTKTGYVRRYVKNYIIRSRTRKIYMNKVHQFQMSEKKYQQLKRAFAGGFTHSNALNTGIVFDNVSSQDLKSSYPASLLLEKYPCSKGRLYKPKSLDDFKEKLKIYCCIFDITFYDIKMKDDVYENIISTSKCWNIRNSIENNGRIVSADSLTTTITEVDYENISHFYNFKSIKIANMSIYRKDYLPRELLECVLHFYKNKTTLKNVIGKEKEYMILKAMLNSIFGMMVTDPIKPTIEFINDIWSVSYDNIQQMLDKYNTKYDRFLVYEFGIYCTAYSRRNIFSAILELKSDYIYSDTDSVKYTNHELHKEFFDKYNNMILKKIDRVCKRYNFNKDDFMPLDSKGKKQIIGQFDYELVYQKFKTLGAKRYLYMVDNKVNLTVSGLNKEKAIPYLESIALDKKTSIFDLFNDELYVSGEATGKLLHTYIDDMKDLYVKDYLGISDHIISLSSIHLEPTSYSLSLADKYKRYLDMIHEEYKKGI